MTSIFAPRFVVRTACCPAPSRGGGKFRRPVVVRVLDTAAGPSEWHWVRRGVRARWENVDSRYDGPRAAYGQAMRSAAEIAARLNAEAAAAVPAFVAEGI